MKAIPLHLQLFTLFQNMAKSGRPDSWWLTFLRDIRSLGIKHIEYMPYTIEKKGLYNTLQPFSKTGGLYELNKWRRLYWKQLKGCLELTQEAGIKMIPVVFHKYMEKPFLGGNNFSGANGLWCPEALKFEKKFIAKLMRLTAKTQKGKPWVRLSNEINHHRNRMRGATIAQHHEAWFERIKKHVPLKNVKNDMTFTDFTLLAEKHYLLKVGNVIVRDSHWSGDPNMIRATWGKDEYDRINWAQLHGMPGKLDVITGEGALKKPWRWHMEHHTSIKKWDASTDGCNEGSGYKIPGTPYCNMNTEEIKAFAREVWGYLGVSIIISELPKEVFYRDGNNIVADDMARLDFSRLEAYAEAWEEMQ